MGIMMVRFPVEVETRRAKVPLQMLNHLFSVTFGVKIECMFVGNRVSLS